MDTHHNHADIPTRGLNANDTHQVNLWKHGPEFLRQPDENWTTPQNNVLIDNKEDDAEAQARVEAAKQNELKRLEELSIKGARKNAMGETILSAEPFNFFQDICTNFLFLYL